MLRPIVHMALHVAAPALIARLHTWSEVAVYCVLLFVPEVRVLALGLVVHIALDVLDCLWMGTGAG